MHPMGRTIPVNPEQIKNAILLIEAKISMQEDKLAALVEWCHKGPQGAKVERVDVTELQEPFVPLKMG